MNRTLVATIMAAVCLGRCCAGQSVPAANVPPHGPLIAPQAPAFAQWSIDYHYRQDTSRAAQDVTIQQGLTTLASKDPAVAKLFASNPQMVMQFNPPRLLREVLTKTQNISQDKLTYEKGYTGERWHRDTAVMSLMPGDKAVSVTMTDNQAGQELPGFWWIARSNYQGIRKVGDRDCLVFQQDMPALQATDPVQYNYQAHVVKGGLDPETKRKVAVVALIDLETRLPVSLQLGDDVRTYTFLAPPSAMLVVPEQFADPAKKVEAQFKSLTGQLSPP